MCEIFFDSIRSSLESGRVPLTLLGDETTGTLNLDEQGCFPPRLKPARWADRFSHALMKVGSLSRNDADKSLLKDSNPARVSIDKGQLSGKVWHSIRQPRKP